MNKSGDVAGQNLKRLDRIIHGRETLTIVMHDYPDPDALASAMILSYLVRNRYGVRPRIVYGGVITRAENRAMVQQLKLHVLPISGVRLDKHSLIAMVDTQPGFGNNSLSRQLVPAMVFDHHRGGDLAHVQLADVRPEYGASATMLIEYLHAAGLEILVDIATAVTYAIRTETQELGRDVSQADIDTYLSVYEKANKHKLAKIFHPSLPNQYYSMLFTALQQAKIFQHLIHVHLKEVASPEFVALIADLLLRHERMGWSLVTGRYHEQLFISMRCNHPQAHAGKMLKQIVGTMGSAGGHPRMAGGQIPCTEENEQEWERLETEVVGRFLTKLSIRRDVVWKPLVRDRNSAQ
ncbi:MAG: DHH family phosphoesterase [Candidatus Zhuqueibacterota bacterium]